MVELGGHLLAFSERNFAEVTEQHVLEALEGIKLDKDVMDRIKCGIVELFL
jgi:hypothetical protein